MKTAYNTNTAFPDKPDIPLWKMAALIFLYLAFHLVFEMHAHAFLSPLKITAWYPPNALALVFLLFMGLRVWPVVILAYVIGNLAVWEHWHIDWDTILPPVLNASAVIVGGVLLTRNPHFIPRTNWSLKDLAGFCLVAFAIAVISGIGTQGGWLLLGRADPALLPRIMGEWILGDMIGLMVLTPFLLVIALPFSKKVIAKGSNNICWFLLKACRQSPYRVLEALALTAFTVLVIHTVFLSAQAQWHNLLFLCYLPVLWAVLRYGLVGATLTATAIAFSGLTAALYLTDPTILFPNRADIHVFQLFTLILVLVGYTLGVAIDELRYAKRSIESHRQELEEIVTVRTLELSKEIQVRRRAEDELRVMNDQLEHRVLERTNALNKARERAERANEAKTRFLQNMSHELHTPLNAILGFAQLLERGEFGPLGHEKYYDYARHILAAGNHLVSLVGDLLEMASLTEENYLLQRQLLDLNALAKDASLMSEPRAMDRRITIKIKTLPTDLTINGDKHRLLQVLLNLVNNAIKYSPKDSVITISTHRENDAAVVKIRDEGPGIAPEDTDRVFERFWRRNHSQLSDQGGMGLGLAIARSLTERHGGTLVLGQNDKGKSGTCAQVRLPLVKP